MMKQYAILDITNMDECVGGANVICQGDTREEAFAKLADIAMVGDTYAEVRRLGKLIVPKERKAVSLSRVGDEPAPEPATGGSGSGGTDVPEEEQIGGGETDEKSEIIGDQDNALEAKKNPPTRRRNRSATGATE